MAEPWDLDWSAPEGSVSVDDAIRQASQKYDVPEPRIRAVIAAESNGDPAAVSRAGAKGLMQLMPGTAKDMGVTDAFDPAQNIDGGTRYLAQLRDKYGDWDTAHAAYNFGPRNIDEGKALPQETRDYLAKIAKNAGPDDARPPWEMEWGKPDAQPWEMPWAAPAAAPKDNPDFQDLPGLGDVGQIGFEVPRGMGETGAKAAKGLNLALGSIPVAMDAIKSMATGTKATDFEDWWFSNMVRPMEERQEALGIAKDASFGEKMAHGFGNLTETLAQVIASTPSTETMTAQELANLTATRIVGRGADHAATAAILPGLEDAADVMQHVYAQTGDQQKAAEAGAAAYVTTAMAFMVPVSAEGTAAQRAVTGAVGQGASGEAGRVMMNAVLPENMHRDFDPAELAQNVVMGAGMGAAMGPRPAAPYTLPPDILSAGNVDDAIAAANRAMDEVVDLRAAEPQPGETPPPSPGEMAAERYRVAADQAIARMNARMQDEEPQVPAEAPVLGEAPRIALPNEPEPTSIPPLTDTRADYAAALEKQQRGELLTGYEKTLLEQPPETPSLVFPDTYRTRQEPSHDNQAPLPAEDAARAPAERAPSDARVDDLQRAPALPGTEPGAENAVGVGDHRIPDAQAVEAAQNASHAEPRPEIALPARDAGPGEHVLPSGGTASGAIELARGDEAGRDQGAALPAASAVPAEVGPKLQDFTTPKGEIKTFGTKALAQAYIKQNARTQGYTPRQVGRGEWALSRPERVRTEAQKANDARLRQRARSVLPTDDLATLLRKSGGINAAELTRDGADPKDLADTMRFGAARKTGGMSLDGAAEVMASHGYDVYDEHGAVDATKARELIQQVLDGERVYTPEGLEARAVAEQKAREADLEPTQQDLGPVELEPHDAVDVGLVARAAEIDESAVERLAIQFEYDDADFMRAVQEIADGHAEHPDYEAARGREERLAPEAQQGEAAEGEPLDREAALARLKAASEAVRNAKPGEVAPLIPELDAAGRGAERSGASDMDIVNAMEGPRRPLGLERRLEILERGHKQPAAESPPAEPEAATRPETEKETPAQAGVSASSDRVAELVARYKPGNPFATKAARARHAYERLSQPTAHDMAMEQAFPLGGGFGRKGGEQRIESRINRANKAVQARNIALHYEARAEGFDKGTVNAQGRSVNAGTHERAEKRETQQVSRDERQAAAKAALEGKERWQVPQAVYADSTGNFGGGARRLMEGDHREAVEKALAEGKSVPAEVLADYPDLRETPPAEGTIASHDALMERAREGNVTPEDLRASFEAVVKYKGLIQQELAKLTKDELLKRVGGFSARKSDPKERLIKSAYSDMLMDYALGRGVSYNMLDKDGSQGAIAKMVADTGPEHITEYAAKVAATRAQYKARVEGYQKALTNPETLEEFDRFAKAKGEAALTSEQRAKYDELRANAGREVRERDQARRTEVKAAGQQVGADIVETKHTQKGHDLFVVRLAERVERDDYNRLNAAAKKLGGYYSSFRGNGAVPGFQFRDRASAEAFQKLAREGETKPAQELASDRREEHVETKKNAAAQRLADMADRMEEKAQESLSKDRLANTARRASMASSAEASARADEAMAKTLRNLANAIEDGRATHLDGVRTKVQVETLDSIARYAQQERLRKDYPGYVDYEKHQHDPLSVKDIEHAKWPDINGDRGDLFAAVRALENVPRTTRLAEKFRKVAERAPDDGTRVPVPRALVEEFLEKAGSDKGPWYWEDYVQRQKRLEAAGIPDLPTLRAALREYVQYRTGEMKPDRVKELERALAGNPNVGFDFFPTPRELADRMAQELDVKPGMTVLEPSAGKGNLADAVREREPGAKIHAVEMSNTLRDILEAKGHELVGHDFDEYEPAEKYDRIIMNPPFSNGIDADHVMRAFDMLKPGGRLVALTGEGIFFRDDAKSRAFREWFDRVDGHSEQLEDAFTDRREVKTTGVNSRLLVIDKPRDLELTGETENEIRAREALEAKAAEEKKKRDNAPAPEGFTLTGSDRAADVAEAHGQKPMFARGPAFYSELERHVEASKTESAPAPQWKAFIDNLTAKGVKRDEIEWSGVKDWLDMQQGKVTKAQVQEFLRGNGVKVDETMLGENMGPSSTHETDRLVVDLDASGYSVQTDPDHFGGDTPVALLRRSDGQRFDITMDGALMSDEPDILGVSDLPHDVQELVRRLNNAAGEAFNEEHGPGREGGTRYSRYTLPGGENYRELLLTLPVKPRQKIDLDQGDRTLADLTPAERAAYFNFQPDERAFRSSHFDQPNILAHVRFDDRTDAQGKKVLFLEELQSDWAQKGKREGFHRPEADEQALTELKAQYEAISKERETALAAAPALPEGYELIVDRSKPADQRWGVVPVDQAHGRPMAGSWESETVAARKAVDQIYGDRLGAVTDKMNKLHDAARYGVPSAPFVGKTEAWVALAVKRMIRYAAENGYDRVAWTNGEQQAARYDLSKVVDSIEVAMRSTFDRKPAGRSVTLHLRDRGTSELGVNLDGVIDNVRGELRGEDVKGKPLADVVGKDVADKIMGMEKSGFLSAPDLRVGGKGMMQFYDRIVPNVVNDVLKKLGGGRVGEVKIERPSSEHDKRLGVDVDLQGVDRGPMVQSGFDITPAMREQAMKGMPLFGRGKAAGRAMPVDQVRRVAEPIVAKWVNPPDVKVLKTFDEAPLAVRGHDKSQRAQGAQGAPYAFFHEGTVYLIADQIHSPQEAVTGLFHEALGHYGLRGLFGNALERELSGLAASRPQDVKELAKRYGLDPLIREDRLIAAEEVLAHLAQTRPDLPVVQRAISAVRNWLREHGVNLEWTDNDILQHFIIPARRFVEEGRGASAKADGGAAFARKGDEGGRFELDQPSALENVIYKLQDKHVDTKAVLKAIRKTGSEISDAADPYLKEELFHGRAAKRVEDFLHHELEPLLQDVAARNVNLADFEKYLVARHAEEANAHIAERNPELPDGGSGMTNAEAAAHLEGLAPREKRAYEALAKRVDDMIEGTRRTLQAYGLEGANTIQSWRDQFEHYVPLFREGHEGEQGPGVGQGFSVRGPATKARTGSTAQVADVLANVAMARERAIVRGEKNRVAKALLGLAEANPNPEFWKVDEPPKTRTVDKRTNQVIERTDPLYKSAPNVVMARGLDARGNAIDRAIIFNEENPRAARMAAALKNLDAAQMEGVISAVGRVTRYFSSINTQYNPVFGVSNIVRDVQDAMLNLTSTPLAGKQADIAKYVLPALRGVYLDARAERAGGKTDSVWGKLFEEFQNEGAQTAYRDLFRIPSDRTKQLERAIEKARDGTPLPRKAWDSVFDWLSDYNLAMENSTRLAAYRVALENGMTKEQAASLAKNLTVNFNRKGALSPQLGALYAFYNASAQGTARMMQTLTGPGGKKVIGGLVGLGVAQALALAFAGFDDNELPDFVKQNNIVIPNPFGGKKYLTVPMPKGFLFLPNLGRIATELALSNFKNPVKRVFEWMSVVADAFDPMGNVNFSAQTFAPTVLDPFVALAENKDWTGRPIAREDRDSMHKTPGYTRTRDVASAPGKIIAQGINALTGGTAFKPGVFSPTGDQIDYLISQATGGVGREGLKVWQLGHATSTGEDLPTYKMPLVGRFYGDAAQPSAQAPIFYDNLRELNEHAAELKGRQQHGEPLGEYRKENPETSLIPAAQAIEHDVAKMQAQKHKLVEAGAPTEQVKALDDRIAAKMLLFNQRVSRARATAP